MHASAFTEHEAPTVPRAARAASDARVEPSEPARDTRADAEIACATCGTQNAESRTYCDACGVSLRPPPREVVIVDLPAISRVTCPECATENTARFRFCKHCGHAFVDDARAEPDAASAAPVLSPESLPSLSIDTPMASAADLSAPAVFPSSDDARADEAARADASPAARPRGRRGIASVALVAAAVGAVFAVATWKAGAMVKIAVPHVERSPAAAPPAALVAALPAEPAPAARRDIPPTMGLLITANAAPGRRIFVDGRAIGQTPQSVLVKCGPAKVKLGSAAPTQTIDVPCGEEISAKP